MPRRLKLLHVRSYLEHVVKTFEEMLERDGKYPQGGLRLAPIDVDHLREMKLVGRAILNHHASKKTRKDVYVER